MRYDRPYEDSELATRFEDTGSLAIFDLDGTIVSANPSSKEQEERRRILAMLKASGVPCVFSSARTPELMMSEGAYLASRRLGFDRPLPLRGMRRADGSREYEPLDKLVEFEHLRDPDAILGLGTGIYPKHRQGYLPDLAYTSQFGRNWRGPTLARLEELSIGGDLVEALASVESETAFARGDTDVFPLPYRIQLEFRGEDGWKRKMDAAFRLGESLRDAEIIDESRPDEGRYVLYVVPKGASKSAMLTWLVERLCETTGRVKNRLSIFIAGDTLTDLGSCLAVPEAESTFVLAGQSRLASPLSGKNGHAAVFAGVNLRWLTDRLKPTAARGIFHLDENADRKLIISDETASRSLPAESVRIHLETWLANL